MRRVSCGKCGAPLSYHRYKKNDGLCGFCVRGGSEPVTRQRLAKLFCLEGRGWSIREISVKLGLTFDEVKRLVKRYQIRKGDKLQ